MVFSVICLDGFKKEYLEKTCFLKELASNNQSGDVFHGFGYASEFSALTGKSIEELGIVVNNFHYNPNKNLFYHLRFIDSLPFNRFFRRLLDILYNGKEYLFGNNQPKSTFTIPLKYFKYFNFLIKKNFFTKNSLPFPTLFEKLKDKKISGYMWPFIFEKNKTRVDLSNLSLDTGNTDDKAFKKSISLLKKKPDMCYIHLFSTDNLVHKYGTHSKKTEQLIQNLDKYVMEISKYSDKLLIYSDHGMTDVKETIDIGKIINETDFVYGKDYIMFLDATLARFWFFNTKTKIKIQQILKKTKKGKFVNFKNKTIHKKFGHLIFQVNPGVLILPNFYQTKADKATHGYDDHSKDERAFYILTNKKKIKKNIDMKEIHDIILKNI